MVEWGCKCGFVGFVTVFMCAYGWWARSWLETHPPVFRAGSLKNQLKWTCIFTTSKKTKLCLTSSSAFTTPNTACFIVNCFNTVKFDKKIYIVPKLCILELLKHFMIN